MRLRTTMGNMLATRAIRIRLAAATIIVALSCTFATSAAATTLLVNTTNDVASSSFECQGDATCSLREAVATATEPGDVVEVPASTTPYAVTLGPIELTVGITISGAGALTTKIEGNGSSRIFEASSMTGTTTISGVTITGGGGTEAAGALLFDSSDGTIDLNADALSANKATAEGGAIQLLSGTLNIDQSTIGPSNVAGTSTTPGNGGAIYNGGGMLSITNSTVGGNSASDGGLGGGIFSAGTTDLSSSTVAFNAVTGTGARGGDIYAVGSGTAANTIVADGTAPGGGDADCVGTITSDGHNLTDGVASTGVASCGFTQATDILADARLGPLRGNGGQTSTYELAAGSPAINAVPATGAGCPATDQRGVTRPQGAACDIGALEVGGGGRQPQWSVAHDFAVPPPTPVNPSPDSLGNPGVWSYEQVSDEVPESPAAYTLLSNFTNCAGDSSAFLWDLPAGSPAVGFSDASTPEECPATATLPSKTVFMVPTSDDYAVLGWTSPVEGIVDATGSFESDDPNAGSGIQWLVDKNSTNVAAGSYGAGGGASFNASQAITPGDTLYFLVGPPESDNFGNVTTDLNLTITQTSVTAADLSLAASANPSSETGTVSATGLSTPPTGDITDTFTTTNSGPSTAANVTFTDPLPTGATLQSAIPSQGSCSGTSTITCALGSVDKGAQATVTVTLQAAQFGTVSNKAKVASSTPDPNSANNSATATTSVKDPCAATSKTLDTVTVTATCIEAQSDGSFLAIGNTKFSNGATILTAGTQDSAPLIIDPAEHMITLAPNADGSAASGVLEAGGTDVADGPLTIATNGVTDPVAKLSGMATIGGIQDVTVALSGWSFLNPLGGMTSAYLTPTADGGGVLIDGRLSLSLLFAGNLSGSIATQVAADGSVSVISGGLSLPSASIPGTNWGISNPHLLYERGPDEWSGGAGLSIPDLFGLTINPLVIKGGRLDALGVKFSLPPPGIIIVPELTLGLTGASLSVANLQSLDYNGGPCNPVSTVVKKAPAADVGIPHPIPTPPVTGLLTVKFVKSCPPPVQIAGSVSLDALDGLVTGTGSFKYVLDGSLTVTGSASLAPPFGGQLGQATFSYTPPHIFELTGSVLVPTQTPFLKGSVTVGIAPPHFTGEASLDLIVPTQSPVLGGDNIGGVQAIISDKGAAASANYQVCIPWLGCASASLLVGYKFASHSFQFSLDGNINDYNTVGSAASVARTGANRRTVRLHGRHNFVAFTVRGVRGTPDVELISPSVHGHRLRLTLASSRALHNHSGALASVDRRAHEESFLVAIAPGGLWTARRLHGPKIGSVLVAVPRKQGRTTPRPLVPRASDLPRHAVSTSGTIKLAFSLLRAPAGTTVDLWAGTEDHGGGGVLIAEGLPPSAVASWKLTGLGSGRYWPYAVVNRNGLPVAIHYWPRSVEVVDPAAPATPADVGATFASGRVLVGFTAVATADSYGITATPADGAAPVMDAVPAGQLGEVLSLPKGRWSITVEAVDAQDRASLPSAPISVTVP